MSLSRHEEALCAFERNDSLISGLQTKISSFQKNQKHTLKIEQRCYEWIRSMRNLSDAEAAVSTQILHTCSYVLELLEKDDSENCTNTMESLKDLIVAANNSAHSDVIESQPSLNDICRGITRLKQQFKSDGHQVDKDYIPSLMRILRNDVTSSLKKIDSEYMVLYNDCLQHSGLLFQHYVEFDKENDLPSSISYSLNSLRSFLMEQNVEDEGLINCLEDELREDFDITRTKFNRIFEATPPREPIGWNEKSRHIIDAILISSNHFTAPKSSSYSMDRLKKAFPQETDENILEFIEYHKVLKANKRMVDAAAEDLKRQYELLENDGLQRIQHLRDKLLSKIRTSACKIDKKLQKKELQLRLDSLRLERKEALHNIGNRELRAVSEKVAGESRNDFQRFNNLLKNKKAVLQRRAQEANGSENGSYEYKDALIAEVNNSKLHQANKKRSIFREEQLKNKLLERKKAVEYASRALDARREKLDKLASTVPYYNTIKEKSSNIHKTTNARVNDVYCGRNKLPDFQCGNLKGFTNEKVFSDAKYRLGIALHEAGLSSSIYARDKVREVIPRSEERTTGIKPY